MNTWIALGIGFGVSLALGGEKLLPSAAAQSVYAYPMAGQTLEQHQRGTRRSMSAYRSKADIGDERTQCLLLTRPGH